MAIVENVASEIGDIIRIRTEVPVVGLLSLSSFIDSTEGETGTFYFKKEFRYSNDAGLNFTSWLELTLLNIQNVEVTKKDQFILEYRYTVSGVDEGDLTFNSVTVSGDFENLEYPVYRTTLFNQFFDVNDVNVLNWAINVLEKLYQSGILPEYIERNAELSDNVEDKDFTDYWGTMTHFFALIVYYYRKYENIPGNKILLKEFLSGKDLFLSTDDDLQQLSYILYNQIDEYRKRGTERIIYKNEENGEGIDGEFLRIINWQEHDEMLFALTNNSEIGWCLGKSSPMWDGTENIINLIKAYEYTEEVNNLSKYPLINSDLISIVYDSTIEKNVMKINSVSGTGASVGIGVSTPVSVNELINVSESLDYEISFFIKKDVLLDDNISFRCIGYDQNLTQLDTFTLDSLYLNSFIDSSIHNILLVANKYYHIRGILFNYDKVDGDLVLNFRGGRPLRMQPTTKYISIQIIIPDNTGCNFYLYDIKVRPLFLPMTQGLLGTKDIIFAYINNRGEYLSDDLEYNVQRKLIPYNSWFKATYWEDSGLLPSVRSTVTFYVKNESSDPIVGANIFVNDNNYTTNESGIVQVDLFNGIYSYIVTASGYSVNNGQFEVSGSNIDVNIVMTEVVSDYIVTFRILNKFGGILYNTDIVVDGINYTNGTDVNGEVDISLSEGSHSYSLQKQYFTTQSGSIVVLGNQVEEFNLDHANYDGFGYLYNWYVLDIASDNDGLLTGMTPLNGTIFNNIVNYVGDNTNASPLLRSLGTEFWNYLGGSSDATDIVGFKAVGTGYRNVNENIIYFQRINNIWMNNAYNESQALAKRIGTNPSIVSFTEDKRSGYSVRCFRSLTTQEQSDYSDGDIVETVQDYDSNNYDVIKINNIGIIKQNLKTTHYMNGTSITEVSTSETWNSTSPAYCKHSN